MAEKKVTPTTLGDMMAEYEREELAIIRNPRFGLDDREFAHLTLTFAVYTKGLSAGIELRGDDIRRALARGEKVRITDIRKLDGRACIVENVNGLLRFKRLFEF